MLSSLNVILCQRISECFCGAILSKEIIELSALFPTAKSCLPDIHLVDTLLMYNAMEVTLVLVKATVASKFAEVLHEAGQSLSGTGPNSILLVLALNFCSCSLDAGLICFSWVVSDILTTADHDCRKTGWKMNVPLVLTTCRFAGDLDKCGWAQSSPVDTCNSLLDCCNHCNACYLEI